MFGTPAEGHAAFKRALAGLHSASPNPIVTVEGEVTEGDKLALRWTMRGMHRGDSFGRPPTGKAIAWSGITIYRLVDRRAAEEVGEEDAPGVLQRVEAVFTPELPSA
jgi:predicted ester cyclase